MDLLVLASIWPTTVEGWVTLITLFCGLIGAIAGLIPLAIKVVKKGKELVKNKNWEKIKEITKAAMEKAQASGKAGADKKAMVMEAVKAACKEAEIEFDEELINQLSNYIDKTKDFVNGMKNAEEK